MKIFGRLYFYLYFVHTVSNTEVNTFKLESNGDELQQNASAYFFQEVAGEQCLHRCAATVVLALSIRCLRNQ